MVNRGLKGGTTTSYKSGVKLFLQWFDSVRDVYDCDVHEMNEDMWILYISFESLFVSSASIDAKLSAIKEFFLFEFGFDPFRINGMIMHKLEKTRRELKLNEDPSKKKVKFSVTKEVLRDRVRSHIDSNDHDGRVLWAICCLGVSCLLRLSEVAWTGAGQEKKLLRRSALELEVHKRADRGVLGLDDTKTKLHGDVTRCTFYRDGSEVCPWNAKNDYLKNSVVELEAEGALFRWKNGKVVRAREFNSRMKSILEKGGINMNEFAGYSLRRGRALSMALAGVPDRVIRAVGRWKSYAYRIYIDLTDQEKLDAQVRTARLRSSSSWRSIVVACGGFMPSEAWYR